MAKEIECKLMGITPNKFINLAKEKGVKVSAPFLAKKVIDIYWELPNVKLLRHRTIIDGTFIFQDITVKSCELNTDSNVSEREEIILNLKDNAEPSEFLDAIGAIEKHSITKRRTFLDINDSSFDVYVHHDKVLGTKLQWIEVEADKEYKLMAFLDKLGIVDTSSKSTLEILGLEK